MWELDYKECWAPKNWCFWTVVLEKNLESPLECKEIQPVHPKGNQNIQWKDWWWNWNSNTLATWCEELTHWKRPWSWERLKAGGEGDYGWWGGWMASPTKCTWVWVNSGSWWWTGRPCMLQSMGSQRVWTEQLNWTEDSVIFPLASYLLWRFLLPVSPFLHHNPYPSLADYCGGISKYTPPKSEVFYTW